MYLYEFEGKYLLSGLGITAPQGRFCRNTSEAEEAAGEIGYPCVIKSQVLTGGRGKAGGVAIVSDADGLVAGVERILNLPIAGELPIGVLVEEKLHAQREVYVAVAFDTSLACPVLLFSPTGGVEVEAKTESLFRLPVGVGELDRVSPASISSWVQAEIGRSSKREFNQVDLPAALMDSVGRVLADLLTAFCRYDLELVEINPLVFSEDALPVALDTKMTVDDDALFRHPDLTLVERPQPSELEARAREASLQFVDLDGEVCIMANGAGLNLCLLDAVEAFGCTPANFLDTGGGANDRKAYEGMRVLLDRGGQDEKVQARLVMLSLAITRAQEAAEGIVQAVSDYPDDSVPIFAVVHGTGAEEGRALLEKAGITTAPDVRTAVEWATTSERRSQP